MVAIGYDYSHVGLAAPHVVLWVPGAGSLLLAVYQEWLSFDVFIPVQVWLHYCCICYENLVQDPTCLLFAFGCTIVALWVPCAGFDLLMVYQHGGCWLCSFPCEFDCSTVVLWVPCAGSVLLTAYWQWWSWDVFSPTRVWSLVAVLVVCCILALLPGCWNRHLTACGKSFYLVLWWCNSCWH